GRSPRRCPRNTESVRSLPPLPPLPPLPHPLPHLSGASAASVPETTASFPITVDARPEQGEIVPHRVFRLQLPERRRHLLDCPPVVLSALQEPQRPRHVPAVHVQRKVKRRGGYPLPHAEIHAPSVVAHHPAQVHVEPFARGLSLDGRDVFLAAGRVGA